MKPRSPRMIYLMIVSGMILILGAAVFGLVELQKDRANRSLSKVAKPVIKMDLLAPMDHGWISDHEIFFLREKNQGDLHIGGSVVVVVGTTPRAKIVKMKSFLFKLLQQK